MSDILGWLYENALALISIVVGIFIAIYLYILEKKRDDDQTKRNEEFNKWMKEQTERQTAMLEALQKGLPKAQGDELAKKATELLPGSVQIGGTIIDRAKIRIAQSFLGGQMYIEAVAYDEEGGALKEQLSKLAEGKTIKFISPDYAGIAQVKSMKSEETTAEGATLYTFKILLQIKG